jgi:hypothetical protein
MEEIRGVLDYYRGINFSGKLASLCTFSWQFSARNPNRILQDKSEFSDAYFDLRELFLLFGNNLLRI